MKYNAMHGLLRVGLAVSHFIAGAVGYQIAKTEQDVRKDLENKIENTTPTTSTKDTLMNPHMRVIEGSEKKFTTDKQRENALQKIIKDAEAGIKKDSTFGIGR